MKNDKFSTLIKNIFSFDMTKVVKKFASEHNLTLDEAREYEKELKRYLSLAAIFPDRSHDMRSEMVDALWHTFILHTVDYVSFCKDVVGHYIHHIPSEHSDKKEMGGIRSQDTFEEDYRAVFQRNPPETIWNSTQDKCGRDPAGGCKHIDIEIDWEIFAD